MSLFAPHSPLESSIENTERHDFKKISMPNQFMVLSWRTDNEHSSTLLEKIETGQGATGHQWGHLSSPQGWHSRVSEAEIYVVFLN